ncbi:MAG: hypothetical protein ABI782_09335 [Anaerolineaceae bacterium]
MTAFNGFVRDALASFAAHEADAKAGDSRLLHHLRSGDAMGDAVRRQFDNHVQLRAMLTTLIEQTCSLDSNFLGQMVIATDAAVTAELAIALHHRRLERILASCDGGRIDIENARVLMGAR